MVFTDAKPESFMNIIKVFDYFGLISGLHINKSKSTIFAVGNGSGNIIDAASNIGIQASSLPIRYLGLPLTTRTMKPADYAPLIDTIRGRFLSWTSKYLSYAGRLQLIKSVISSITNFWCSVFRLPIKCFEEIEQMCGKFLWSGSPLGSNSAKVSWEMLCTPKTEGGLGLRRLKDVSRVFALNLVWRLFTSSGSLWVAWTRHYLQRGSSFWVAPNTTRGSWIWKKLLKLRADAAPFIRVEIQDGKSTSFWYDHWLSSGRLIDVLGNQGPRLLGIPITAMVADAANSTGWKIRSRSRHFQEVIDQIHAAQPPNVTKGADIFLWKHKHDVYRKAFTAKQTWHQTRMAREKVPWHRLIWFRYGIPSCSFISWLAILDRLSTGHRMRTWGRHQACVLCDEPDETRDHLFFACPYSFTVWTNIGGRILGQRISPDWDRTIHVMLHLTDHENRKILLHLAFQATLYHIWRERNTRIHRHTCTSAHLLTKQIQRVVKNRITSLNYQNHPHLQDLFQLWLAHI